MWDLQGPKLFIVLTLLVAAPVAGCLEDAPGPQDEAVSEEEARSRYTTALSSLQSSTDDDALPQRMSMQASFQDENGTDAGTMHVLVDPDGEITLFTVRGDLAVTGTPTSDAGNEVLIAQVGKTTVLGTPEGSIAMYNDTAEPVEGIGNAGGEDLPEGSGLASADLTDPASILQSLEEVPQGAEVTTTPTTYQGKDALEVRVVDAENGTTVTLTLWVDPDRPALLEADLGPNATPAQGLNASSFRMEFQYDDDAHHPRERAVTRLATMAFLTDDDATNLQFGGSSEAGGNWTIQPNPYTGTVPLTEVTAQVVNRSYGSTPTDPILELALEDGTAENDRVRLTYEDVDGDGHVSQGDRITLTPLTDDDSYQIVLLDEDTGLRLVPGGGFTLALLTIAGTALARRRG